MRLRGRTTLLFVDEGGYLLVIPGGRTLFFRLVNARYERGAMMRFSLLKSAYLSRIFTPRLRRILSRVQAARKQSSTKAMAALRTQENAAVRKVRKRQRSALAAR
jgi:DNA replication protein DnaC